MGWTYAKEVPFGDKMLWAAVLRRAVFDFVLYKSSGSNSLEWKRAFQFIFGDDEEYDGLNFEQICELFNWEPGYIRRLVAGLAKADIKKMEIGQMHDEFVLDSIVEISEYAQRWKTTNFAVPFIPPYNYSKLFRSYLTLRKVGRETKVCAPLVRWKSAA